MTVVLETHYGKMMLNPNDINQYGALLRTERSIDHDTIEVLIDYARALPLPPVVLDIGANFGTFSLALAPYAERVNAFEAQRIIFNMLCGSVALNRLENVFCHNQAIGREAGLLPVPKFDYTKPLNFGSVEFGPEQTEPLGQTRGLSTELVYVESLDDFVTDRIDIVKIDVEGMEVDVLEGGANVIRQFEPIMLVEYIKSDRVALRRLLEIDYGYTVVQGRNDFLALPPGWVGGLPNRNF